ncbi:IS4 family transposase, partial [Belliella sp. DSM 111904]
IFFIMSFKTALQRDLDRFYKALSNDDFNIREVTKGALSQARAKLNPWAFRRLNEVAVAGFYSEASYYVWHGMRVLAVDGSRLMLPRHETVIEEFGEHSFGPKADSKRSMAICSMLYDVLNHLTIDSEIAPYSASERDLLMLHLEKVNSGDILLLDRGYPCFWLLFLLKAKGIEFCVRLKDNWWLEVNEFRKSPEREKVVKFNLPKKDREKLSEHQEIWERELECRLVKVELDNGEIEILCTSLLDSQKYDAEEFGGLYHLRWNEEEAYKLLKSRVELEAFSGKTAKAVKQDFHAKVFLMTMCAAYAHPIEEKVKAEYEADKQEGKHGQKINKTNALAMMMDMAIPMFIKKKFSEALNAFDDLVYKTREVERPGRKLPRLKKPKKPHYMNYKPI